MQYTNLHEGNTYKLQTCMQYTYLHEGNTYKLIFFKGPQKASPPTRNIIYNQSISCWTPPITFYLYQLQSMCEKKARLSLGLCCFE